jgi:hypothetical protein
VRTGYLRRAPFGIGIGGRRFKFAVAVAVAVRERQRRVWRPVAEREMVGAAEAHGEPVLVLVLGAGGSCPVRRRTEPSCKPLCKDS